MTIQLNSLSKSIEGTISICCSWAPLEARSVGRTNRAFEATSRASPLTWTTVGILGRWSGSGCKHASARRAIRCRSCGGKRPSSRESATSVKTRCSSCKSGEAWRQEKLAGVMQAGGRVWSWQQERDRERAKMLTAEWKSIELRLRRNRAADSN